MNFTIVNIAVLHIKFLAGPVLVQLPNGKIKGRVATTFENKTFYAFEGIPYAAPPVGNQRFKPPQAVSNWGGILDTTRVSAMCVQIYEHEDRGSEDCLYINVYTPQLPGPNKNAPLLPVMLFIHGGGFKTGAGEDFQPDLFVNQHVIVATINYRLGIFGFISTQDEVIPGNNGLKDQRFAIQWVHDNIGLFGGDPDRVTIFGESAGSASCAYQLLNLDSKGLFQGAILQSGSFLSPWTYQRRARQIAFGTAALLNSTFNTSEDSQALLDYLLTVDARTLDNAAQQYHSANLKFNVEILQGFTWAPIVEVDNPDAFLTEKMYGLLKKGDLIEVPIMIGVTSEESLVFNPDPNTFKDLLQTYDQRLELLVPDDMGISDEKDRTEMGRKIRDLYTEGKPLAENLGDGMRYCSDTSFTRSVIKHAEIHSVLAPTYFYILSFDGAIPDPHRPYVHYEGAEKVAHDEDMAYLICSGTACDDSGFPEADRKTRRRMVKMWTDFAKYKNPTPESSDLLQNVTWPCVQIYDGDFLYLDIDENLTIKNHPKEATYKGWVQLYDSLDHDDFDTY